MYIYFVQAWLKARGVQYEYILLWHKPLKLPKDNHITYVLYMVRTYLIWRKMNGVVRRTKLVD